MKKKYVGFFLLAVIFVFSACGNRQETINMEKINSTKNKETESDKAKEGDKANDLASNNKEENNLQNKNKNEEKDSNSNSNDKQDRNTANSNGKEKNNNESDTNNSTFINIKKGEYLLSEPFNNKQRVELILKGEGQVKYFIDDVQVFGGYYLDAAKIRLIVSGNCKLLISGDLTGKIVSVKSSVDTNNLIPGMYEAGQDFPLGTYEINLLLQTEPSSLTILENLKSLEIAQNTLIDSKSGNGDQYSIDRNQILVLENIISGKMLKK